MRGPTSNAHRVLAAKAVAPVAVAGRTLRMAVAVVAAVALALAGASTAEAAGGPTRVSVATHQLAPSLGKAVVRTEASVVITRGSPWLVLSHSDQETVRSGGVAWLEYIIPLVACPFVGPIACLDLGFAVTAIQIYITEHGVCSRSRSLYLPLNPSTIVPPLPMQSAFCR